MSEKFRSFLTRIAGDGKGDISEQRLEEWLCQMSGRVVRTDDGRSYRLVRTRNPATGRNTFRLEVVQ